MRQLRFNTFENEKRERQNLQPYIYVRNPLLPFIILARCCLRTLGMPILFTNKPVYPPTFSPTVHHQLFPLTTCINRPHLSSSTLCFFVDPQPSSPSSQTIFQGPLSQTQQRASPSRPSHLPLTCNQTHYSSLGPDPNVATPFQIKPWSDSISRSSYPDSISHNAHPCHNLQQPPQPPSITIKENRRRGKREGREVLRIHLATGEGRRIALCGRAFWEFS
ncbi:hypothetical protein CKAN_00740100 [Cinnamomum micranthum f. kanehirae]|uniref:Uncharacterized protein n=1 Tax=Cinnamomum micranthum f. kanehirae TaxID=337451 RepID=A0A3S3N150_9MAGN|nr:hypothetical protein CKAN_00740100 [Cinnamomum micranthum f. kanehirae]